jgi:hypothetical protein
MTKQHLAGELSELLGQLEVAATTQVWAHDLAHDQRLSRGGHAAGSGRDVRL